MPTLRPTLTLLLALALCLTVLAGCRPSVEPTTAPTPGSDPTSAVSPAPSTDGQPTDGAPTEPAASLAAGETTSPTAGPTDSTPVTGVAWRDASSGFSVSDALADTTVGTSAGVAGRWIVIGTTDDEEAAASWISSDGQSWQRVVLPASADVELQSVTDGPNGLVAVGFSYAADEPVPAGWHSLDGQSWQPIGGDLGAGEMSAVAAADGYLALGSDPATDGVIAWSSADGIGWSAGSAVGGIDGGAIINGLIPFAGGYLAYGATTGEAAAVWHSADGFAWQLAALPQGQGSTVSHLAAGEGKYVAVGARADGELAQSMAWLSPDGLAWEATLVGGDGAMYGVAPMGDGFVAVGAVELARFRFDGAAWLSADGLTWSRLAADPSFGQARMYGVLAGPAGVLVVGERSDASAEVTQPALWVATAE